MRSHQISQIPHFQIKYEFGISFKREKRLDAEDEILMMGYLLIKRKMREKKYQQKLGWRNIFTKGISWGI